LQLHNDNDVLPTETVLESVGQFEHADEPAAAYVFLRHVVQVAALTAATVAEARPAPQFVHCAVPVVALN